MAIKYSEYGTTVQPRRKRVPEDIPAQAITQPRVDGSAAGSPFLPTTTTPTPTYTPAAYPNMRVDTSKIVPLSERTGGAPMTPAAQQLQGILLSGAVQKGWTTPEKIASIAAASGEANPLAGLATIKSTTPTPTTSGGAGGAGALVPTPPAGAPTPGFPGGRTDAQRLTEAQARAKMQIDLRREGLAAQQRQLAALSEQQRREQLSGLARMTEAQRYQFAGSNLGTSGFLAGAGAVAQGQTQENIGRINEAERAQLQAIEEQRAGLNRLEGDITTATLGELERGDFARRIQEAESASRIAGEATARSNAAADTAWKQAIDEAKLTGVWLRPEARPMINQIFSLKDQAEAAAASGDFATVQTLSAQADTIRAQLMALGVDANRLFGAGVSLQESLRNVGRAGVQTMEGRLSTLNAQAKELELSIESDPNIGTRARKQADLDKIYTEIRDIENRIANRGATAAGGESPADSAYTKRRAAISNETRDEYSGIGLHAADIWADVQMYANSMNADGSRPGNEDVGQLLDELIQQTTGLTKREEDFLRTYFWAIRGQDWAEQKLDTFRKKPLSEQD